MKIETINIKEFSPPSDVAVANLEIAIEAFSLGDTNILKVIHGYGSHGVGGEIKRQMLFALGELKKFGKIKDFISGEKFGQAAFFKHDILNKYPELVCDKELKNFNSGVTIIFLKDK